MTGGEYSTLSQRTGSQIDHARTSDGIQPHSLAFLRHTGLGALLLATVREVIPVPKLKLGMHRESLVVGLAAATAYAVLAIALMPQAGVELVDAASQRFSDSMGPDGRVMPPGPYSAADLLHYEPRTFVILFPFGIANSSVGRMGARLARAIPGESAALGFWHAVALNAVLWGFAGYVLTRAGACCVAPRARNQREEPR